jgi:hypothetical protein
MSHQTNKMRASITSYGFCNKEEEKKKETDKELTNDDKSDN